MQEQERVLRELRNRGCIEPAKVTTYHAYRDGKSEITLEVHDSGEGASARYMVYVRDEDGNVATGNPMATLEDALRFVHWGDVGLEHYEDRES